MSEKEYSKLHLNQRVKDSYFDFKKVKQIDRFGYVTKIYKGNYQIQVWFDGEKKPKVLGYKQVEIVNQ